MRSTACAINSTDATRPQNTAKGRSPRSIYEVYSTVEYVETHYHKNDQATVTVTWRTNGGPEQSWQFPH